MGTTQGACKAELAAVMASKADVHTPLFNETVRHYAYSKNPTVAPTYRRFIKGQLEDPWDFDSGLLYDEECSVCDRQGYHQCFHCLLTYDHNDSCYECSKIHDYEFLDLRKGTLEYLGSNLTAFNDEWLEFIGLRLELPLGIFDN